ncbi:hypothetical protein NQ317_019284, partial [Molorchus minor]
TAVQKVFCFSLPETCPVCEDDLSEANFSLLPFRLSPSSSFGFSYIYIEFLILSSKRHNIHALWSSNPQPEQGLSTKCYNRQTMFPKILSTSVNPATPRERRVQAHLELAELVEILARLLVMRKSDTQLAFCCSGNRD